MSNYVTLRAPDGTVQTVDPDRFDVAAATKDGFTQVGSTPKPGLMSGLLHVPSSAEVAEGQAGVARGLRQLIPGMVNAIPTVGEGLGAMGGGLLGGGVGGGATAETGPLALLGIGTGAARGSVIGAGLGRGAGQLVRDYVAREMGMAHPASAGEAATNAAEAVPAGMASQLLGINIGRAAGAIGRGLYGGALRAGAPLQRAATVTAGRIAGAPIQPDEASLVSQGLAERVPLGRGPMGTTGADRMGQLTAGPSAQVGEALDAAGKVGHAFNIQSVTGSPELAQLKSDVAKEEGGAQAVAKLNEWVNDLVSQFRHPPAGTRGPGRLVRLSPQDLQALKQTWQTQAERFYAQAEKGVADPLQALRARFQAAIASGARSTLENISTPSSIPGKTLGDVIAEANSRLSSLHPLGEAVGNAETRIAAGGGVGVPWWAHTAAPVAGGLLGTASGAGPTGAAGGALAGMVADRALSSPVVASRVALGLTNPIVRRLLTNVPRAGSLLLSQAAEPDAISQGGTR